MPDDVAEAIRSYGDALTPSSIVVDETRLLRAHVGGALLHSPRVRRILDTGSFAHGTAVAGRSRLDCLVVLEGSKPRTLPKAIDALRAALVEGAGSTGAPASALGVFASRLENGDSLVIDRPGTAGLRLIPSYEARDAGAVDTVWVPDAAHRWVPHLPGSRELLLSRIDDDGALRALIRLLIAWKHEHGIGITSYYLETVALRQALQQRSFSLLWDVCWVWERLANDGLLPLPDLTSPTGTQRVLPKASLARSIEEQFAVERAASTARAAINAYMDGDAEQVGRCLRALFGPGFPGLGEQGLGE
ncbi:hypothetical protein [Herbiconiux flava]|uniref:Nucleotidyltransferase n=1 Tax=Herbiconiux flava TaxID=881268 RepID=A0A852SQA5_9MICO|nr:hypothetical protein [Herbiconiux flava]NYD71088.1 hypothetical protein [Herbiconiux flava]GLK18950.1 hypothetical protein GCM10017602_34320 [Herbiconiux flava]